MNSLCSSILHVKGMDLYLTQNAAKKKAVNPLSAAYSNLFLSEMALKLSEKACDALIEGHYKEFDPLIKNCGCQMSALEGYNLAAIPGLTEEAKAMKLEVSKHLDKISRLYDSLMVKKAKNISEEDREIIDIQVSSEMAHLVRFKILGLIHETFASGDAEIQRTNIEPIQKLARSIFENRASAIQIEYRKSNLHCFHALPIKSWIEKMQKEESESAARFIFSQAVALEKRGGCFLSHLLSGSHVRQLTARPRVTCVPEFPSLEVAIRQFEGILVIKNKLKLGMETRKGALACKVFLECPQAIFLTEEEVKKLGFERPVIVIEALLEPGLSEERLKKLIEKSEEKIIGFVNASSSRVSQYPGKNGGEIGPDLKERLNVYRGKPYQKIFRKAQIEHMFVSSVGDEL